MKICAVFSDYDGTLAPLNVSRERSRISKDLQAILREIIVTSKDYDFVQPRTTFARMWACVSGLEIRLSDGTGLTADGLEDIEGFFEEVRRLGFGDAVDVERSPVKVEDDSLWRRRIPHCD